VLLVLAASSLLNAAYFLPLLHRAWFRPPPAQARSAPGRAEGHGWLIGPALVTAVASLGAGAMAGFAYSPLGWATLIVQRTYQP
jgi:multicomponent Na+:H+ antiporter subunit D